MFHRNFTERLLRLTVMVDGRGRRFQLCRHGDALLKILLEESIEVAVLVISPAWLSLLSQFVSRLISQNEIKSWRHTPEIFIQKNCVLSM